MAIKACLMQNLSAVAFLVQGDMTSQNFSLKKATSIYPRKMGLTLEKWIFMSRIVLFDPKLTPMSISAIFKQKKFVLIF